MRRTIWIVLFLIVGTVGPGLTPAGLRHLSGEQRRYAEEALLRAKLHLDNPVENVLVQSIRVVDVVPLSNEKCKWMVTLRAYSLFWFYRTLTVRCAGVSG